MAAAAAGGVGVGADQGVQIHRFRGLRPSGLIPFGRSPGSLAVASSSSSSSVVTAVSTVRFVNLLCFSLSFWFR